MKLSWVMLLASETGDGTPSSGSTPTSAAAWSCDEDAEKWGYSKHKDTDNPGPEVKTWRDSKAGAGKAGGLDNPAVQLRTFAEEQSQFEASCFV